MVLIRSHDALFRYIFGEPEQMAELLRDRLPADVVATIDWNSLRRADGTFVDAALRSRQSDLLFTASATDGDVLLYVLCEHKSAPEPLVPLRLARYVMRIHDRWVMEHPGTSSLPAVVPFLFHHGERPWNGAASVRDLVAMPRGRPTAALRQLQLDQPFVLFDLAAMDDAAITRCAGSAIVGITLPFLRLLRWLVPTEALREFRRWHTPVAELYSHPRGCDVLTALLSWYLSGTPHEPEPLRAAMDEIDEEQPAMRTALDWWLEMAAERAMAKGKLEGLQEGRHEGGQEGRQEGRREVLLEQIAFRFGAVPPDVGARVAAADAVTLQRWSRRLLGAGSLADVFAAD